MSNGPKALDFGAPQAQPAAQPTTTTYSDFAMDKTQSTDQSLSVSVAPRAAPPQVMVTEEDIRRLGAATAGTTAAVSERLLGAQRSGDSGEMGTLLTGLIQEAKGLNPEELKSKGVLGKVKGFFSRTQDSLMGRYDTVQGRIDTMVRQLEAHMRLHEKRVVDLEDLRKANHTFYLALRDDVKKGQEMLVHVQAMIDYAKAQDMTDAFAANKVIEYEALYNMLEKRINDFQRVMIIAQQTEPQLVLMKTNSHNLVDNFTTVKNTTIPLWRQMFSQYLISLDQKRGAALSKSINDATDEALRKNSELFGQNAVAIAEANQRSVVSIERLEEMQRNLFSTLDKVAEIERKGREDRAAAEPRLKALETELVERFSNGRRT